MKCALDLGGAKSAIDLRGTKYRWGKTWDTLNFYSVSCSVVPGSCSSLKLYPHRGFSYYYLLSDDLTVERQIILLIINHLVFLLSQCKLIDCMVKKSIKKLHFYVHYNGIIIDYNLNEIDIKIQLKKMEINFFRFSVA